MEMEMFSKRWKCGGDEDEDEEDREKPQWLVTFGEDDTDYLDHGEVIAAMGAATLEDAKVGASLRRLHPLETILWWCPSPDAGRARLPAPRAARLAAAALAARRRRAARGAQAPAVRRAGPSIIYCCCAGA